MQFEHGASRSSAATAEAINGKSMGCMLPCLYEGLTVEVLASSGTCRPDGAVPKVEPCKAPWVKSGSMPPLPPTLVPLSSSFLCRETTVNSRNPSQAKEIVP